MRSLSGDHTVFLKHSAEPFFSAFALKAIHASSFNSAQCSAARAAGSMRVIHSILTKGQGTIRSQGLPLCCMTVNSIQLRMKYLQSDPMKNISKRLLASMSHQKCSAKSTSALTASMPEQSYIHAAERADIPQSWGEGGLHNHRQHPQPNNWGAQGTKRKQEGDEMMEFPACHSGITYQKSPICPQM